jgi:transcriptional regulator with PAS, ATPase and Fis domain
MSKTIISWIGETDLRMFEHGEIGPVEGFLSKLESSFEHSFLLFNYPYERVQPFLNHLSIQYHNHTIQPIVAHIDNPTSYAEVYPVAYELLNSIRSNEELSSVQLNILLSPGTPTMQAVWVLLTKTKFPAVCWAGYKGEYSIVELPFKIDVEFLEDAIQKADTALERANLSRLQPKSFEVIVGESLVIKDAIQKSVKLSQRNVPALILGPTGSGKEVFAQAIHLASRQSQNAFVAVNCGALPRELAESLLFGHKKGSFTGATSDQAGYLQQANGGTLFLDEIGELSLDLQVKLLRVLQEKTFRPLGAQKDQRSDFRLIAATHRNLNQQINENNFREDLFYRIAIGVITLPFLIERDNDIELIANYLLEEINLELADQPGYEGKKFHKKVINVIKNHSWPGNVRELKATILRVCTWSDEKIISADEFQNSIIQRQSKNQSILIDDISQGVDIEEKIDLLKSHYINLAERQTGGQKTKMAKILGLKSHQVLSGWMDKLK